MKASVIRGFGAPDVLEYTDVEAPEPRSDEVRVRVLACSINRYDVFLRRGEVTRDLRWPHVMGADIAGEVERAGAAVTHCRPGQRVVVAPGYPLDPREYDVEPLNMARSFTVTGGMQWGGYAGSVVVPGHFVLTELPDLPPEQLATLPLVLTTAVHAVRTLGGVGPGQRVLVQAGASGSGAMCIQVARALGAAVMTTVGSPKKFDFVRSLGADEVVDYTTGSFVDAAHSWTGGRGVDVVIDNVGGSVFDGNVRALRRGGHFVNFGMVGGHTAPYNFPLVFYKQIHLHGSMMGTPAELAWGFEQVVAGRVPPILDRTMPLAAAAAAHADIEARRVQGKIVLIPPS